MSDKPVSITPEKLATIAAIEALREYYHETRGVEFKPVQLGRIIQKHVHAVITQVRNSTLEDAAQALVAMANDYRKDASDDHYNAWKSAIANGVASIRALKDK